MQGPMPNGNWAVEEDVGEQEIHALLDRFAHAITRGDTETIATLWGVPSLVLHEGTARPVGSLDEVKQFFANGPKQYLQRGIVDTKAEVTRLTWLTEKMASVQVRWPCFDGEGRELEEERSTYIVMRGNDGAWKIWAVALQGESQPH
ncbi:MAG: DUF6841 family protein [Myxococcaceae bacterium]